jgi:hypothetical protein
MLPLASASGIAVIVLVVVGAALFLTWLLRSEKEDEATAEPADEPAHPDS